MKIALLAIILLLLATTLHAETFEDKHTVCAAFSSFAETAMEVRQEGKSLHQITTDMLESKDLPDELNKLLLKIVYAAYDTPRYSSTSYQQKAIQDFSNEIYAGCMEDALK